MRTVVTLTLIYLFVAVTTLAWGQGGVFVTGHDPDFHAVVGGGNNAGAKHIIQDALAFVTQRPANNVGNILLVTDLNDPGSGFSDPRNGLAAAGYTFTVADDGTAGGSVLDLHTVNFADYNAVVVASDFGGWLRQSELDILDNRSPDILNYINHGGGLVAFAESGTPNGLTTGGQFGFLPFLVSTAPTNLSETGNTLTPFGQTLGLTDSDINGNFYHNVFTTTGGMNVVDIDPQNRIISLAFFGTLTPGGVGGVPEPSGLALVGAGMVAMLLLCCRPGQRRELL
ncbi:MAG TPA: PEP-CTERM sorting domain-containing protein [Chthonomonadaceae bacterium]|nr:PEP-CTERM sorting domain-containing protein [Chthonomonadaceae bacterium]